MSFYDEPTGQSQAQSHLPQGNTVNLDPRFIRPSLKDEVLKEKVDLGGMYTFKARILPFYEFEDGAMKMETVNGRARGVQFHYALKQFRHKFKESGKFHNLACTKTVNKWECPICEANIADNKLGKEQGIPEYIDRGKRRSKSECWILRILVEHDYVHPENNGKVMLWEVTGTIYGMIQKAYGLDKDGKKIEQNAQQLNPALAGMPQQQDEMFDPIHVAQGVPLVVICAPDPEKNGAMPTYKNSYWERDQQGQLNKSPLCATQDGKVDEEATTQRLAEAHALTDFKEFLVIPSDDELRESLSKVNAMSGSSANESQSQNQGQAPQQFAPPQGQAPQQQFAPQQQAPQQFAPQGQAPQQQLPPQGQVNQQIPPQMDVPPSQPQSTFVDQSPEVGGEVPPAPEPDLPF